MLQPQGKKAEKFNFLMEATKKQVKLKEKRVMIEEKKAMLEEKKTKIAFAAQDGKMLTLKVEGLDDDARMIMQVVRFKMLRR